MCLPTSQGGTNTPIVQTTSESVSEVGEFESDNQPGMDTVGVYDDTRQPESQRSRGGRLEVESRQAEVSASHTAPQPTQTISGPPDNSKDRYRIGAKIRQTNRCFNFS